jgi:hypothetical protein
MNIANAYMARVLVFWYTIRNTITPMTMPINPLDSRVPQNMAPRRDAICSGA